MLTTSRTATSRAEPRGIRPGSDAVRVLIVDDSAVTRRMLSEALGEDPVVEVVGQASSGVLALQMIPRLQPDVITLDVEMPGMDGIETLKQIRGKNPAARVIMFSSLTERGAPVTLTALMHGASDYCAKPVSSSPAEARDYLRRELLPRVRQFKTQFCSLPKIPLAQHASHGSSEVPSSFDPRGLQALLIGISTGGPQALSTILPHVPADYPLPILIVQHMPPTFTRLLAERLNHETKIRVEEAREGQAIIPGTALLAPGGYHMRVRKQGDQFVVKLDQEPPENSCRPAVDVLFRSAAEVWKGKVLAAVLTGMGQDGLRGARALKERGAWLVAQDEASSVVWGMPGAIAAAGLADEILDLHQIIPALIRKSRIRS